MYMTVKIKQKTDRDLFVGVAQSCYPNCWVQFVESEDGELVANFFGEFDSDNLKEIVSPWEDCPELEADKHSWHIKNERRERIEGLAKKIQFTSAKLEVAVPEEEKLYTITTTGIIVIRNLYTGRWVTAYPARMGQAMWLYRKKGKRDMDKQLKKKIQKNMDKYPELFH